jgi:hypothetical protein
MTMNANTVIRALDASNVAPVKGILFLCERQTEDEQEAHDTKYKNERGFRVNHAKRGTELAEKVKRGESLSLEEIAECREICKAYAHTQLLDLARSVHGG